MQPPPEPAAPRSRHTVEVPVYGQPAPAMSTPPQPAARHRGEEAETEADEGPSGQHTGGQSVAELLARLQSNGTSGGGGRRRRRED